MEPGIWTSVTIAHTSLRRSIMEMASMALPASNALNPISSITETVAQRSNALVFDNEHDRSTACFLLHQLSLF